MFSSLSVLLVKGFFFPFGHGLLGHTEKSIQFAETWEIYYPHEVKRPTRVNDVISRVHWQRFYKGTIDKILLLLSFLPLSLEIPICPIEIPIPWWRIRKKTSNGGLSGPYVLLDSSQRTAPLISPSIPEVFTTLKPSTMLWRPPSYLHSVYQTGRLGFYHGSTKQLKWRKVKL